MAAFQLFLVALGKTTPILLACMGGMISELAGVINFALEAMMLTGAFLAVWLAFVSGSPWLGLMGGALGGMLIGLMHSLACLKFRTNQIVSSIALNLLAAGATGVLLNQIFGVYGTSPSVAKLPTLRQCISESLPFVDNGPAWTSGEISILAPLAIALSLLTMAFFRWSVWGLRIKACGENPLAAKAAGLPVTLMRSLVVLTGGALAGMGGAYLSIGELSAFVEHMTQGRGYLAIAALILGRWKPLGILLAALLFGFSEAFSEWLAVSWANLPHQFFLALPYLICLAVLTLQIGKTRPPSSLGRL